ncbi:hypothetical protein HGA13_01610 [Nocardia speluncae]|uniref:Uncharacterized protein n=1 Tax=Nocardia speluncae TaxID=419477 RepID=A0A846XCR0_9NOCA|nr:hypothetical protein [Nocardia speluncae]NKY31774.1 hypothetical protein [Nocardia speluncae]
MTGARYEVYGGRHRSVAPALDLAYNGNHPLPDLYAGAPEWVADPVVNPRAGVGLLSFCYWWERGRWYRGRSPPVSECAAALPSVWSSAAVAERVIQVLAAKPGNRQRQPVVDLIAAAHQARVTSHRVALAFGGISDDIAAAVYQFRLAGLLDGL